MVPHTQYRGYEVVGDEVIVTNYYQNGKSQFFSNVDAEKAVLDAAAYADKYGLWQTNNPSKAVVPVTNGPVGVLGNGTPTNYINVYKTSTGYVHGCPGSGG